MKFRKRPVVVEAVRVKDVIDAGVFAQSFSALPAWVGEAYRDRKLAVFREGITIPTLEGLMTGEPTDWLIRGVQGELYPCKPDIFAATYETADSGSADK